MSRAINIFRLLYNPCNLHIYIYIISDIEGTHISIFQYSINFRDKFVIILFLVRNWTASLILRSLICSSLIWRIMLFFFFYHVKNTPPPNVSSLISFDSLNYFDWNVARYDFFPRSLNLRRKIIIYLDYLPRGNKVARFVFDTWKLTFIFRNFVQRCGT